MLNDSKVVLKPNKVTSILKSLNVLHYCLKRKKIYHENCSRQYID